MSNGFLLIDKPEGISSFDVIRKLRKITGIRKMGHTGTLDPFATGLLIVCLGKYTRLAQFIEAHSKVYQVSASFGSKTDTGDPTGQVTETTELPVALPNISDLINSALSLQSLAIPAYSAVKINGKRAYQYAREGKEPDIPDREVTIHEFSVDSLSQTGIDYICRVSKGTYIRSLSQWIAAYCGTLGVTTSLRRIAIGGASIDLASSLEQLDQDNWTTAVKPAKEVLQGFSNHQISLDELTDIYHGRSIAVPGDDEYPVMIYNDDSLIAVAERRDGRLYTRINLSHE